MLSAKCRFRLGLHINILGYTGKGGEIRGRLVARGFDDEVLIQKDSPTVGKSAMTMRVLLAIAASKQ